MVAEIGQLTQKTSFPLTDALHNLGIDRIPYKSKLSFEPLIRYIRQSVESTNYGDAFLAKAILECIDQTPELLQPIENQSILNQYEETIQMMMTALLPPALRHTQLAKVSAPFEAEGFYVTPAVEKLLQSEDVEFMVNQAVAEIVPSAATVVACNLILKKYYGKDLKVDPQAVFSIRFSESGVERHFKVQMNMEYLDVQALQPVKPLSEAEMSQMLMNIYDTDLWLYHLPIENFEMQGLVVTNLVDITEEEALSRLKFRLLRKDAIVEPENIHELENLLRTYFAVPDLYLGVTALDYPDDFALGQRYRMCFNLLGEAVKNILDPAYANSIYDKVCKFRSTLLIEDLENYNPKTPLENALVKKGIQSIIVAPILDMEENVIGIVEIASPRSYELHSFIEIKLKEVVSLFTLAVGRSREEMDNRVEALLREQFTTIHPSVEWRFLEASHHLLDKRENGDLQARVEPIVFKDVYPLYGQSDIVGSSVKRNVAIQVDLLDNLNQVKNVLIRAHETSNYPLLGQLLLKVNRAIARLEKEFNSQDETSIVELLHEEIHPLLQYLRNKYPQVAGIITIYFNSLDTELGIVYRKRKAFEESVTMVNNAISTYLSQEEIYLQDMLPHYFEKYQTDGVEFEMYVGQSLLRQEQFCSLHLKNFRLWQLKAMIQIARRVHNLQNTLPVPLETAQLIFAYTTPLSIRFRMDEKQFDVDGAYNVRYEILKKRIDKALIEGTDERLTLPGKVAVVYLQDKDRQEYLEYMDYLRHEAVITGDVEDLHVANLQGAQGLRALRVTVKVDGGIG